MADIPVIHTIEADSVMLALGRQGVLNGVYLSAASGTVTGILGSNGSGKSSLFRIMSGMLRPRQGAVRMDGELLEGMRAFSAAVKYLPQFNFVPRHLSAARVFGDYGVCPERFESDFPEIRINGKSKMGSLSGGERRLIETYIVLRMPAPFVILDEPFSQLSPLMVERLKLIVKDEASAGKCVILTDHLYRDVADVSDAVWVLGGGVMKRIEGTDGLCAAGYVPGL